MLFRSDSARYGLHVTVAAFAAATAGFVLLLFHHRAARRWTLMRWHQSRLRAYHETLPATIAFFADAEKNREIRGICDGKE